MKQLLFLFLIAVSIIKAFAGDSIPAELVGDWRTKTQDGEAFLLLRADGWTAIGSSIGAGGSATYDPKRFTLTVSLRDDTTSAEMAKMTFFYDPKVFTLTSLKLVAFYDMHGPTGRLPKPKEENPRFIFTRHSRALPESLSPTTRSELLKQSK